MPICKLDKKTSTKIIQEINLVVAICYKKFAKNDIVETYFTKSRIELSPILTSESRPTPFFTYTRA